jgi:hypothetical protein
MTATDTRAPTAEELREQLASHEETIAEAERQIGAAALDGKSSAAATKRIRAARTGVERCQAALEELERREQTAEEQARLAAASAERLASYRWAAEWLTRWEALLVCHAELKAAEEHLRAYGGERGAGKILNVKSFLRGRPEDSDLDTDLIHGVPEMPQGREIFLPTHYTIERFRAVRELANTRAEQEERGEGTDWSGVPSTAKRESQRRNAERGARPPARSG